MNNAAIIKNHFCKYPVIYISFKNYTGCDNWQLMAARLHEELARLYEQFRYIYSNLSDEDKIRYDKIVAKDPSTLTNIVAYTLFDLTKWLENYHSRRCIILIDDYDHPLNVAFENNYYEDAHKFLASIFQMVFKDNEEYLEKALLMGIYPIAKLGFHDYNFFPMNENEFADKFGFTENEVSAIFRYHNLGHQEEIKKWYGGYEAGDGIQLYNPLSVNCYINQKTFKSHQTDICDTTIIKLMRLSSEQMPNLHVNNVIIGKNVMNDIDYENGYHLFMVGLLSQAKFRGYKIQSNKEEGFGRFDLRIDPESQVEYETSIIMEFKVLKNSSKNSHINLKESAKEGLKQILDKKYRTGVPRRSGKLVECGIAFQGKQICILSRVLTKIDNNQWVEM
ncbi:hypothetical protein C2G38_2303132 [Gigaspora rosea]|uniref:AAA-ATPase-like domain-containing protein n=1 Tax=Gigaspora rosea TaxID=44941 RepID=A0A397VDZ7_9GLOM|nr:hypothetical protein C2G38_2303132 [Gigaspora rosea]